MQHCSPQPPLTTEEQLAVTAEAEISHATRDEDLANQPTPNIPAIDAVAAPGPHVAVYIAFDPVRGAGIGIGKDSAGSEEGRAAVVLD